MRVALHSVLVVSLDGTKTAINSVLISDHSE